MASSKNAVGKFCWFECGSKDAAKAKSFYTEVFGWQAADVPMPGGGGTYTLFKVEGEDIAGLYPLVGPQFEGVPSNWATYVSVEDVDDTARRAVALGGKAIMEPMDIPDVGRIAYLQDPTGAHIGIAKLDPHPGSSDKGPFGYSELATRDAPRAKAFYTELFDWNAKADAHSPYTEFQVGGRSIGGMLPMTAQHGDAPPHWLPYVAVDDCDRIVRKAGELGARTLVPPTDIANVGRFSVFADPTGAALAVIKLSRA